MPWVWTAVHRHVRMVINTTAIATLPAHVFLHALSLSEDRHAHPFASVEQQESLPKQLYLLFATHCREHGSNGARVGPSANSLHSPRLPPSRALSNSAVPLSGAPATHLFADPRRRKNAVHLAVEQAALLLTAASSGCAWFALELAGPNSARGGTQTKVP